ncbi:MAG: phospholipase/carboxylesterase [Myxococcota bacterium]|jgi:phospholipase/carboxylesterase
MNSLVLGIEHRAVEAGREPPPTGEVHLESGSASATLLTPTTIDPTRQYPLFTVLHGAGRQDEMLVKACRDEPDRRDAFFLVPRSVETTWDLIVGGDRRDVDFLEYAYDLIYRRYPIDRARQVLIGYSDGASVALSLTISNPCIFDAALVWAAGFVMFDGTTVGPTDPKPRIYLEYGTHDELFSYQQVALPMQENLTKAGYPVHFSTDEGGRHWPSKRFQPNALDWYFASDT